jgi:hypothetical protein
MYIWSPQLEEINLQDEHFPRYFHKEITNNITWSLARTRSFALGTTNRVPLCWLQMFDVERRSASLP